MRAWSPGDYYGLVVHDDIAGVSINSRCLVLGVRYRWDGRGIPYKTLNLLETGQGTAVTFWEWGRSTDGGGDVWR